ncbi:ribosome maturation factor RimM [Rhodococcus sp. MEB064]|uniref:ribosome maturation factor RimM n=1 Tax=Rhodococcus sp. MEB064 TaxID=1587522 RepID=UPI0005ACDE71|nr:ribosome maturation factor RimM [Rhodococcus sp. MEB064]KIQ20736.1 16S rRNA processing protein RimM [Rhodococcus sp. MEB064]
MELVVGRVAKSHGIKGEIVVEVRTDDPDERFAPGSVLHGRSRRDNRTTDYTVEAARDHSGRLLLRLKGISDRGEADALRGTLFVVDTADLPASDDPDEFYDHELEGMTVQFAADHPSAGEVVGTVTEVLHSAAGELLSIAPADESVGRELLVPFVAAIVVSVSRTSRTVEIDPPEGLLDGE